MENRAVIMAGTHIGKKIFDRLRRFFGVELEFDLAVVGGENDSHESSCLIVDDAVNLMQLLKAC
jgi:hypothetical protein